VASSSRVTTRVVLNTNVVATFSEAMDAATLNSTTFTLTRQGDTTPVAATVSYDAQAKKAVLDPAEDLRAGGNLHSNRKERAAPRMWQATPWTCTKLILTTVVPLT
jgi:hypothetical protein